MLPNESEDTALTERISSASRVGLWKILAASLFIVIVGFGLAAGLMAQ